MTNLKIKPYILLLFALLLPSLSNAEIAVIVHSSVADSAEKSDIQRIFLGKTKSLPGGHKVVPLDLKAGEPVRQEFGKSVLKKSESQLKSYWSKLIFTGKGQPPKEITSEAEIVKLVAGNPNFIGYVSSASVTDGVKVLATY